MSVKVRKVLVGFVSVCMIWGLVGCSDTVKKEEPRKEDITLNILAAASLTDTFEEIGELYTENTGITLQFNFDSSGTLKTQIENGAPADIFVSAATKQMNELNDAKLIQEDSIVSLLENKVVLIKPRGSDLAITSFSEVTNDEVGIIAIGNSDVPVGQYTETIYTNLNMWDAVKEKATLGTNVRQVLDWVATNNADCGIVYATDAAIEKNVEIICEAPVGTVDPVIYPAGIVKASEYSKEAADFIAFLQTKEAIAIFEKYGFEMYKD